MNPFRPMLTRRGLPAAALHGRDPVERKAGQGTHRYPPVIVCLLQPVRGKFTAGRAAPGVPGA
jgi:hypothetical protein